MKKNLIIYATQYGCTEEVAKTIASKLEGETDLVNIKNGSIADLQAYDRILIGGSIYAGNVQKEIKEFTAAHEEELLKKPLGIFLCGIGLTDSGIANSFEFSFKQEIREHAKIMDMVGGKLDYSKMKFMDKLILKIVTKRMIKYKKDEKLMDNQLPTNNLSEWKIAEIARVMNKF